MFERYTEKARRTIFFARHEASQLGSPLIQPEHLLLGLLREDKELVNRFLRSYELVESIRKQIKERAVVNEIVPASVDLPLSEESKRIFAYSTEEADGLSNNHIGTEHLLLAILRADKTLAAKLLNDAGLDLASVRSGLSQEPHAVEESRLVAFDQGTVVGRYVRDHALPENVAESLARILFIVHRREIAIVNNETAKARFYEGEERKERENLRLLYKQGGRDQ